MARDGLDALILTGGPDIYSHGGGVAWGAGLIDDRGMCQYMVLPLKGEPTLIYPHLRLPHRGGAQDGVGARRERRPAREVRQAPSPSG